MRNSIIVNVSQLRSLIQDVRRSGSDFVKLEIVDEEQINGETYPPSLELCSCRRSETDLWIDYDPLDAFENEAELMDAELKGAHMSDNLL